MTDTVARPTTAVAALVTGPSGRSLLVRTTKWRGLWGVPGGKVEYGESLEEALRREFMEETGLELEDPEFAFVAEINRDPDFHKPAHFVSIEFLARSTHEDVRTNDEIEAFEWLSLREALELPLNRYSRRLVEVAMRRRGERLA